MSLDSLIEDRNPTSPGSCHGREGQAHVNETLLWLALFKKLSDNFLICKLIPSLKIPEESQESQ